MDNSNTNINNQIKKIVLEQVIEISKAIFNSSNKKSLTFNDFKQELNNIMKNPEEKPEEKHKEKPKEKSKEKPKEKPEEENICIAFKKDGERCKGKKNVKGKNPDLCFVHNKNGVKFGMVSEQSQEFTPEKPEIQDSNLEDVIIEDDNDTSHYVKETYDEETDNEEYNELFGEQSSSITKEQLYNEDFF